MGLTIKEQLALPEDLMKILPAARRIGVSRRTIYNWIEAGKIELWRTAGGSPRVSLGDLVRQQPRRQRAGETGEGTDAAAAGA